MYIYIYIQCVYIYILCSIMNGMTILPFWPYHIENSTSILPKQWYYQRLPREGTCLRSELGKTNSSPREGWHPKRKVIFQPSILMGYGSDRDSLVSWIITLFRTHGSFSPVFKKPLHFWAAKMQFQGPRFRFPWLYRQSWGLQKTRLHLKEPWCTPPKTNMEPQKMEVDGRCVSFSKGGDFQVPCWISELYLWDYCQKPTLGHDYCKISQGFKILVWAEDISTVGLLLISFFRGGNSSENVLSNPSRLLFQWERYLERFRIASCAQDFGYRSGGDGQGGRWSLICS